MKKAIVTGASSGIGRAITYALLENEFEVFAIGRDFSDLNYELNHKLNQKDLSLSGEEINRRLHIIVLDLLDTPRLLSLVEEINKNNDIQLLVNSAGVGYYGLHESLKPDMLQTMLRTNLEVPLLLSNLLLKNIKKNEGFIVNISSHTASKANPHGCAYGATKAGLSSFSKSLFEEERKYGLKVINIEPDMAKTNLYRDADFCEADDFEAYLLPEEIAEAVIFAINQRPGCIITDIHLQPKLNKIMRKNSKAQL